MAGVLDHIREITVFLNPLTNSYARFGAFEAPRYLSWSHQNRSQLIRIPAATGAQSRMELRSPDPSCNPHLAFAMLLQAGLDGIRRELPLCPAVDLNLYDAEPGVLEKNARAAGKLGGSGFAGAEQCVCPKRAAGKKRWQITAT